MNDHSVDRRQRRGAPWTDADDERLLRIADLPPREIAEDMQRSWHACRRRLAYLRANGSVPPTVPEDDRTLAGLGFPRGHARTTPGEDGR